MEDYSTHCMALRDGVNVYSDIADSLTKIFYTHLHVALTLEPTIDESISFALYTYK